MSAKNRTLDKKIRKLERALSGSLPAFVDVVRWLQDHGYAKSNREAMALIHDGRVKVDSHTISTPHVEARYKNELVVVDE